MKIKSFVAAAAAAMSFTVLAALNVSAESGSIPAGEISINRNGFEMSSDENGDQFVCGYIGFGGEVTLPPDAAYVAANAFEGNTSITSLTVPKTCWNGIESRAFAGCANLKKVVFEGDIEFIGEEAFLGCINLRSVLFKGDCCESEYYGRYDGGGIGEAAFFGCRSLKSVRFEHTQAKLNCISESAFENCLSLSDVKIPDNTPTIYPAFINCPALESVNIPLKTMIDKYSFGYLKDYSGYDDDPLIKADGFTSVEMPYYYYNSAFDELTYSYVSVTAKKTVLSVVAGSDAERMAEKYKIDHVSRLKPPENVAVLGNNGGILLMWNTVYGADAYRVYKYDYTKKRYIKYKDVTKPELKITGIDDDETYKFIVTPLRKVKGKYEKGLPSKPVKFRNSHTF